MLTDDYRVRLDVFEGPLDLLLYLVKRSEVDLHDIPIAQIADQYLTFLTRAGHVDVDGAGEFLLMAASLLEIKSRTLTPARPGAPALEASAEADADPRADLVRRLLEYRGVRDAAGALEQRERDWARRFPAGVVPLPADALAEVLAAARGADPNADGLDEVTLLDLGMAYARIAEVVNFERLGEHTVTYDDTPQELHAEDILDRLRRGTEGSRASAGESAKPCLELRELLTGRRRTEMVGLFLALLELIRRQRVRVRVDEPRGIVVEMRAEDNPSAGGATASDGEGDAGAA